MWSFAFISFALDCIEKAGVFCLVRWEVAKSVGGGGWLLGSMGWLGVSGNAATVD